MGGGGECPKQSGGVAVKDDRRGGAPGLHEAQRRKIGEEAAELVTACADDDPLRACEEVADVIYHALVALRATGGSLRDVERVLSERRAAAPE